MYFNSKQIQKMIEIFSKNQAVFIGSTLGLDYLSEYDKFILKLNGIDLKDINVTNDIQRMFYFGMYSEYLGGNRSYKSSRKEFDRWMNNEMKKPMSTQKKVALDFIKTRNYNDLSGLGSRYANNLTNKVLSLNLQEQALLKQKMTSATVTAFEQNKTAQQLASILRDLTEDTARDFSRIADYTMQEAYAHGRVAQIIETYGEDSLVYKQTFPGVCKHCEANYGTPGQKPVIYTLPELMANGTNIGRSEQLPVVGPAHPWARSILHPIPVNSVWSDEKNQFILVRNTQGVKRNSKVKITITE
jgi:hypothetical protein